MPRPETDPALPVLGPTSLAWVVALEATDHPHLARPTAAWHDDDGVLRVRVDVPGAVPLGAWAEARGPVEPGEAVTVLLPVLAAVAHLRHRGATVSGLDLDGVLVDARGAPVLARAELDEAGQLAHDAGLESVLGFVSAVLDLVRWSDAVEAPCSSLRRAVQLVEVVELVHDLADPLPLATVVPESSRVPVALVDPPGLPEPPAWTALLPESEVVERALAWWSRSGPRGVIAGLRAVRPRSWAAGIAVVGALVASTALFGRGGGGGGVGAEPTPARSDGALPADTARTGTTPRPQGPLRPDDGASAADTEVPEGGGAGAATGTVTGSGPEQGDGTAADRAVRGEDAGDAARVLLPAREECLRELDGACLREVDHGASPLLRDDLAFLAEPAGAPRESGLCADLTETARWGGSALLRCERDGTTTASVLVVRTEAGWRLREIAPGGDGS